MSAPFCPHGLPTYPDGRPVEPGCLACSPLVVVEPLDPALAEKLGAGLVTWCVRINGQSVGRGGRRECETLADELKTKSASILLELVEDARVNDALCECGHEGRNHGCEGEKDSCYYRKTCGCKGWKEARHA